MDVNSQEWSQNARKEYDDNQVAPPDHGDWAEARASVTHLNITRIKPGEEGKAVMPYSEVCMHLRVAGKMMRFRLIPNSRDPKYAPSVQLLNPDGSNYSFPIGQGEGGVYYDHDCWNEGEDREYRYYYYKSPIGA